MNPIEEFIEKSKINYFGDGLWETEKQLNHLFTKKCSLNGRFFDSKYYVTIFLT